MGGRQLPFLPEYLSGQWCILLSMSFVEIIRWDAWKVVGGSAQLWCGCLCCLSSDAVGRWVSLLLISLLKMQGWGFQVLPNIRSRDCARTKAWKTHGTRVWSCKPQWRLFLVNKGIVLIDKRNAFWARCECDGSSRREEPSLAMRTQRLEKEGLRFERTSKLVGIASLLQNVGTPQVEACHGLRQDETGLDYSRHVKDFPWIGCFLI